MRVLSIIFHCSSQKVSGVKRCAFSTACIFERKSITFFVYYLVVCIICFECSFRTVTYSAVRAVSKSKLYFLKRHTRACACGAIIFWEVRKRLRRKNFIVVARAPQLL